MTVSLPNPCKHLHAVFCTNKQKFILKARIKLNIFLQVIKYQEIAHKMLDEFFKLSLNTFVSL